MAARMERFEEPCGFQWPKARTIILISLYNEHREKFELPQYTDIQIWRMISNKLNEEGFSVTPAQVDTKWRGLKKTFKKIKLHNSQFGNNWKHWEFYSLMDNAIGRGPEIFRCYL
ncbi:trihelix transcription factor GT-1-like [Centruroides sculpturatus]|uniref:trihelix transcription factor GT-1-like n=1 Tax=Centruroides sculpturatus TaxID=218467 RepID=UPI000C6DA838|nr:trihelix transcription factor GT-1-like [Centruroides sculpturatus]